jgi:hypothetical protein
MKTMISKLVLFCLLPICAFAADAGYTILNISEVNVNHWIKVDSVARIDSPKLRRSEMSQCGGAAIKGARASAPAFDVQLVALKDWSG